MGKKNGLLKFILVLPLLLCRETLAENTPVGTLEQTIKPEISYSMSQEATQNYISTHETSGGMINPELNFSLSQSEAGSIPVEIQPESQTAVPIGSEAFPVGQGVQENVPIGQGIQDDIPVGQTEGEDFQDDGATGEEAFGKRKGRFHPILFVETRYTDNLYNTNHGKENDFILSVATGLWIAIPANREKLLELGTTTTSPGGMSLARIKPESTRKTQTYLLYSPEFVFYSKHSGHNDINHKAEGMFQYNFNMGLSLDFVDQFNIRSQANNNGISETLDTYKDNIFNVLAVYEPSEKLKFRLDYSNYFLDYEEDINAYMDRTDNSYAAYIFYKIKPRTSIFVEYEFSDIAFDTYTNADSVENRYYAGLQWDVTAKTRGRLKLGYIDKDFDRSFVEDQSGFSWELQTMHNFNPKRAMQINTFQRFNESNMIDSYTFLTSGIRASWLQRFSEKWSGTLMGSYTKDNYKGIFIYEDKENEREDKIFSIAPALRYEFKKWLLFDLGYAYTKRNSNFDIFDFKNNTIFFRADFSM